MKFTQLDITKIYGDDHGRQLWKLRSPLTFELELNGVGGISITVPSGYVTDFASVPRFLWPLFPPTGQWCEASVIHDYLCQLPMTSRFLADAIFREAMFQLEVPTWRRVAMYYAVRIYASLFVHKDNPR